YNPDPTPLPTNPDKDRRTPLRRMHGRPKNRPNEMKASILTIGDEILIGQITDTNSVSIARRLNAAGIAVLEKCSIGDERPQIVSAVERLRAASEIVVLPGRVGPTQDDITELPLADLFGSRLVRNEAVDAHVRRMLAQRGIAYNELNRGQAVVPEC